MVPDDNEAVRSGYLDWIFLYPDHNNRKRDIRNSKIYNLYRFLFLTINKY